MTDRQKNTIVTALKFGAVMSLICFGFWVLGKLVFWMIPVATIVGGYIGWNDKYTVPEE